MHNKMAFSLQLQIFAACILSLFSKSCIRVHGTTTTYLRLSATSDLRKLQNSNSSKALKKSALCGCNSCDDSRRAGDFTCAQRVMGLITDYRFTEEAACNRIAKISFVEECAEVCDFDLCDGRGAIDTEAEVQNTFCGCDSCTSKVWDTMAGEFTCGSRISFLTNLQGVETSVACHKVGGIEYRDTCGACDPETCHQLNHGTTVATKAPQTPKPIASPTPVPQLPETAPDPQSMEEPEQNYLDDNPLFPETPLYCFPEYNKRQRYNDTWGRGYTMEVKEGTTCGPSGNRFSRNTVFFENDELTLQFKKSGNHWEGSEVRILLPQEEMPYHYGQYSFSVKAVQVIDSTTGTVVDSKLPLTMILGLFTWDATGKSAKAILQC